MQLEPLEDSIASLAGDNPLDQWAVKAILWARFLDQTGDPDMSFIISATEQLSKYIHKGMVVVLQSTTYPGTTRELLLPKLGTEHGLKVGEDWFLAFSPERVDPGREDCGGLWCFN